MNADELQRFEARLRARRDELVQQGDIKVDPNREDPTACSDEDAQPLNEMNQVIASKRNRDRATEVQRINSALRRLRDDPDDFGFCAACDEAIPPGRLELMPWAIYCVRCQQLRGPSPRGGGRRHLRDFSD